MEVLLLDSLSVRDVVYHRGAVVDIPDEDAQRLIEQGKVRPAPVIIQVDSVEQVLGCDFT